MSRLNVDTVSKIKSFQATYPDIPISFLISLDDIAALCAQGQPIKAIKGYLALDGKTITTFFLACVADGNGGFDDYGVPGAQNIQTSTVIVVQGLPCPTACGKNNVLNS